MSLLLDQEGKIPVLPLPSTQKHRVCVACGTPLLRIHQRKDMPQPILAPSPYVQNLLEDGTRQVVKAKAKATRQEFAEKASTWTHAQIVEEMTRLDLLIKSHEKEIAEALRKRMILEDQLVVAEPAPAPPPEACLF